MVLQKMRGGTGNVMVKAVLLGFLFMAVVGLVMTDVQGFFRGGMSTDLVAKGGGIRITTNEFDRTVRRTLAAQGISAEQAYQFGLIDQILQSEVQARLMSKEARDLGLVIGDDIVLKQISDMTESLNVEEGGRARALQQILRSQGISEGEFIASIRQEMGIGLLRNALVSGAASVSDELAQAVYQSEKETRAIEMIVLSPQAVKDLSAPGEDNLKTYYEANRMDYALPATRSVTLAFLSEEHVKDQVEDAQNDHGALERALIDTANQIDDTLASGEDFAAVVKEFGLTTQTVKDFRQTGFNASGKNLFESFGTDGGRIIDAAFDYQKGEVAPVLELSDGRFVAVRIDETTEMAYKPFEDVQDELKKRWAAEQRSLLNRERAQEALKHAEQGAGFKEIAASNDTRALTHAALSRQDDNVKAISPIARAKIFSTDKGESLLAENGDDILLIRVTGVTPGDSAKADKTELAAIKQRIAQEQAQEALYAYIMNRSAGSKVRINQLLLRQLYGGQQS